MGGLLKSPKPKAAASTAVVTPIDTTQTTTTSPAETAQQQRIESLKRQARGQAATIQTSPQGLLTLAATDTTRKSLLGE